MAARKKQCSHEEHDVNVVSITPAPHGWGLAVLWEPHGDFAELTVRTIAAWAQVRCNRCAETFVVPMTSGAGRLEYDLSALEPSEQFESLIIEPGCRPAVEGCSTSGRRFLKATPGSWTPGYQPLEADAGGAT